MHEFRKTKSYASLVAYRSVIFQINKNATKGEWYIGSGQH